jgi:membrane-bound lytic murein transglycosylase F
MPLLFSSCKQNKTEPKIESKPYSFDLDSLKVRGHITALVDNSTTSYFTYKGQPMGFEYEMLKRFAESQNLKLEVKVMYNLDNMVPFLQKGFGDIVAANITVTRERLKDVSFSEPLLTTRQVLIQRRDNPNKVQKVRELAGRTVHVRKNSSFYPRLKHLEEELGKSLNIVPLNDSADSKSMNMTIQLMEQVANGEIEFTVADENIAKVQKKLLPNLDISLVLSLEQGIAWAVRKSDTTLLNAVNKWLVYEKKRNDFHTIYTKYFKARTKLKHKIQSEYSSIKGGISPYDSLIRTFADSLGWNWRLLAAQIYQESKFETKAEAWTGASGLMQLMPTTAAAYGVDSNSIQNPEMNLRAGTRYLMWLDQCWQHTVKDSTERIKFVLASFNVGLGHIIDARNLAAKYEKDPTKWDNNVAEYILKKSEKAYYTDKVCKHGYCRGSEPYAYVEEIMERYRHYQNLIQE